MNISMLASAVSIINGVFSMLQKFTRNDPQVFVQGVAMPNVRDITTIIFEVENSTDANLMVTKIYINKQNPASFGNTSREKSMKAFYNKLIADDLTTEGRAYFPGFEIKRGEKVQSCIETTEHLARHTLQLRFENMQNRKTFKVNTTIIDSGAAEIAAYRDGQK